MTVKELKELLERLIEDGKEDYVVYVDDLLDEFLVYINDKNKEVIL